MSNYPDYTNKETVLIKEKDSYGDEYEVSMDRHHLWIGMPGQAIALDRNDVLELIRAAVTYLQEAS